jgi:hypothetical protein
MHIDRIFFNIQRDFYYVVYGSGSVVATVAALAGGSKVFPQTIVSPFKNSGKWKTERGQSVFQIAW